MCGTVRVCDNLAKYVLVFANPSTRQYLDRLYVIMWEAFRNLVSRTWTRGQHTCFLARNTIIHAHTLMFKCARRLRKFDAENSREFRHLVINGNLNQIIPTILSIWYAVKSSSSIHNFWSLNYTTISTPKNVVVLFLSSTWQTISLPRGASHFGIKTRIKFVCKPKCTQLWTLCKLNRAFANGGQRNRSHSRFFSRRTRAYKMCGTGYYINVDRCDNVR